MITAGQVNVLQDRGDDIRCTRMVHALMPLTGTPGPVAHAVIPGNPLPWARAASSGRQRYTPARLRAAENRAAACMTVLGGLEPGVGPIGGNLALAAIFYRDSQRTVDADNLLKLILDAGTQARLWHDDRQITAVACAVELDREHPRTVVALARHESSMRRDLRRAK